MKKLVVSLLLLSLVCIGVAASAFPENWSDIDRENFKTVYGDTDIKEFFEVANLEEYSTDAVIDFLKLKQGIIAPGLITDDEGYLVDAKKLELALEEEKKRQDELLANKNEQEARPVITVPTAPLEKQEQVSLKTNVIIAVCAILFGGVFAVAVTGKKKK